MLVIFNITETKQLTEAIQGRKGPFHNGEAIMLKNLWQEQLHLGSKNMRCYVVQLPTDPQVDIASYAQGAFFVCWLSVINSTISQTSVTRLGTEYWNI